MSKKATQRAAQSGFTGNAPTGQIALAQAMEAAARQIDAGNLAPAEATLRQVLQQQPGNPFALHLMGVLAHRAGQTERAIDLIGKAIDILPTIAQFHSNRGEMCRLQKRLDEAIAHGEEAVRLDPGNAVARSNLGIAYYDRKDYERAAACQTKALETAPALGQALNNLGSIRRGLKDKEGAVAFYHRALAAVPNLLEARNNLGAVLTEMEHPEEALTELLQVIRAQPNYADAHCNIGQTFLLLEQFDKAEFAFRQTLALEPDNVGAFMGLARTANEQDRFDEARAAVEQALALAPDNAEARCLLGDIHSRAEAYDKAEAAYREAMALDPELIGAHLGMGLLHMELGRLGESQASFGRAMAFDPKDVVPHVHMVQVKKVTPDDPSLKRIEAETEHIGSMPATKAIPLHFALGKAYDDLREYDKAFPHFLEGCRLKRARIDYDADNFDLACRNIREAFNSERIAALRGSACKSDLPIFVLGMPRSGTTLVETIIASHPDVYGAGELKDMLVIANEPREGELPAEEGYPLCLKDIGHEELTRMGERYVTGLRQRDATAGHITDKMPANFLLVGLIHLALPAAKIVHVRRNPVDTCLSGFTKLFHHSQHHSYDLGEMGRYYVNYHRLMEHWRAVLPAGAFLDVQYEELVGDQETQTRRLIEFCGLEWNDACMESHKTERSVKTASVTQVRQPMYKTSVEKWRHYEKHLGPLLDALGDLAPR